MKILCFTDTHGSSEAFSVLKSKSRTVDLLICCGDFTIFERNMNSILKKFNSLGKPMLIIPGNHEISSSVEKACEKFKNITYINKSYYADDNVLILGLEGNGFTLKDRQFEKDSKRLLRIIKQHKEKKVVLVTHAPPYGTAHDEIYEEHCGNESIRKFIEKVQPSYALCGHIHENNYSKDMIGKTKTLNPGPNGRFIRI